MLAHNQDLNTRCIVLRLYPFICCFCNSADNCSCCSIRSLLPKIEEMKQQKITPKQLQERAIVQKAFAENAHPVFFKWALLAMCTLFTLAFTNLHAQSEKGTYFNNVNKEGVILDGYDAVAFFTDNQPVKGDAQFQTRYQDATYYFASQEHLDAFKASPGKYKPQFGGWCAYAVSLGRVAPIDVSTFSIVNDRLLLQHNQRAVKGWNKDVRGNLAKADQYWPQVSAGNGKQIKTNEEKAFLNDADKNEVIMKGYDAVAYFTQGAAVKGNEAYSARYNGATYLFSSEANASMFKDHPEMFAPQYGAFCGYAMSINKLKLIDPSVFQIYNGRLILHSSRGAYDLFNKEVDGSVVKADGNWRGQVKKYAGKKDKLDEAFSATASNN
jgi:YHS domain-containing protein